MGADSQTTLATAAITEHDDDFDAQIGASAELDVRQLMDAVRATVARKTAAGAYRDLRIAQAERHNLQNLRNDEQFFQFYMECLQAAACVDINDFEIYERRRLGAGLLVTLKKAIWQMLKFYTYRLWSQQNQINGLLVTAIESLDEKYRARITALERQLQTTTPQQTEEPQPCQSPNA